MSILSVINNANKKNLDISKWKPFVLKDLFEVKCSKYHDPKNYEEGNVPYIARTTFNNGEIKRVATDEELYPANCLTIGAESAKAFYQTLPFITGNKTYRIYAKQGFELNEKIALFIATLLNKVGEKYTYSNAFVADKIENTKLYLPIDSKGNPDWQYMENYIGNLETTIKANVKALLDTIRTSAGGGASQD